MTFDAELGWRPLPNVSKIGATWGTSRPATTNSHGWRDRERTYAKPPRARRVVAVGDSYTFGTDVDDGERFTDVLPALVDRLEVLNLGVAGYGTDQELRLLETEVFRYQPDVVILTICVFNDLTDIGYERLYSWPKPYYSLEDGRLRLWKPVRTWGIRARTSSYPVESVFQRFMNENLTPRTAATPAADMAQVFDALVQRIAAVTAEHGARLVAVLAYPPRHFRNDFSDVARRLRVPFDHAGVPTLDTRKLFADRSPASDRPLYAATGVHWNARGHAIVAEGLRPLLLLDEAGRK